MIYLHKILPVFVSPIFIVLALSVIGLITRRRAWGMCSVFLLYAASMPIVADHLVSGRDRNFERLLPSDVPVSDAVVVLGQGMSWIKAKNSFIPDWSDPDRFFGGVELMLANKAPRLVFTGGKLPWQLTDETEGDVLSRYAQMMQVSADRISVTEPVENTDQTTEKLTLISFLPKAEALNSVSMIVREFWGLQYYRLKHFLLRART
jgi:uncharacterized SAM-binding protein YcdF (DUF218 family)